MNSNKIYPRTGNTQTVYLKKESIHDIQSGNIEAL